MDLELKKQLTARNICPSCRIPWEKHPGIENTCQTLYGIMKAFDDEDRNFREICSAVIDTTDEDLTFSDYATILVEKIQNLESNKPL